MTSRLSLFLVGSVLAAAQALGQGIVPLGPDFQVNTYTSGSQSSPAVAVGAAGGFVVVWQSSGSGGDDNDGFSIQARRFDEAGQPLRPDFQVNTYTTGNQFFGRGVATDAAGNFVVVWQSDGSMGDDTYGSSIQARRFDAAGNPLRPDFQVNSYTPGYQRWPTVATAAGNFVVVWDSPGSMGDDTYGSSIQGRRFGAAGQPLGPDFQVNSYTWGQQEYPTVAADAAGNFIVVWQSTHSSGDDANSWSIQGRRFDAAGSPLGPDFQVNVYTTGHQRVPAVAASEAGEFVVTWISLGSSGDDTSGYSSQARRFDATGNPVAPDFQVNTYTTGSQGGRAVAAAGGGSFIVAWDSFGSSGGDTDGASAQARRLDRSGDPVGPQFQVNTYTSSNQGGADVNHAAGTFFFVWASDGSSGDDTDASSIQARLYSSRIFADSFESGDTSAWSATVP